MLRARVEAGLAILATILAVVTLVWPTWIESVSGLEPDGGTGEAEWWLAFVFAALAAALTLLARRDYRLARGRRVASEGT